MREIIVLIAAIVFLFSCSVTPNVNNENVKFSIYVSKTGDDSNSGNSNKPYFSIHKALEKAYDILSKTNGSVEILIEDGVYIVGDGLGSLGTIFITNYKISLIGGWNSDFSSVIGISFIDLTNTTKQALVIRNVNGAVFKNLGIINGKAYSSFGGGVSVKDSLNVMFTNVIVSNNTSALGGGIFLENVKNSRFFIDVVYNTSFSIGGGVLLTNSHNNEFNFLVFANFSGSLGGGVLLYNSSNNRLEGIITNNVSVFGAGLALVGSRTSDNNIKGFISRNNASSGGGGIYISNTGGNNISAAIIRNSSPLGGGIYVTQIQGLVVISESLITETYSVGPKRSVIYISNSTSNLPLILDKCQIGGVTSGIPIYGIYEDGVDISGHTIIRSIFYTNTLQDIYVDPDGNIPISGISTLNITLSSSHDAFTLDNIVSNY
ncbi:MAG: hypothetical protein N2712_06015 [Brevinematales bacterium]|nr:hypothetical protein [Brevinematales bacterium]